MTLSHIDHFVLTVASIQDACDFYAAALGMEVVRFGEGRVALAFGQCKINLHPRGYEFDPKARVPTAGSGDFCLISSQPVTDLAAHLRDIGVEVEEGPVRRTGATGSILSIYFRDPDGNLVEVANLIDGDPEN